MDAVTTSLAPKGQNSIAQGFSPGFNVQIRYALKGHPICGDELPRIDRPVAKRRLSGATFRALLPVMSNPGLKPWAVIFNRFAVAGGRRRVR
jgi:hypothetical protein